MVGDLQRGSAGLEGVAPRSRGARLIDSPQDAADRRRELDLDRRTAQRLGEEAVTFLRQGWYPDAHGGRVGWSEAVDRAMAQAVSIPTGAPLPGPPPAHHATYLVEVANETSLAAARRLAALGRRPLVLNMANGVQPGGGFLSGARAQEEYLCRSSALFATLVNDAMYPSHAARPLPDSTDWAILSPDVPVFRDDTGTPLDEPWLVSVISSAAPYAPTVGQPRSADLLDARIARVLDIAQAYAYTSLVLGAWGCGAFANDTARAARDFRRHLENRSGAFEHVVFAITDWSQERRFLGPFAEVFDARSDA
jgi:uncharacterized protein (TIGR02452 family)